MQATLFGMVEEASEEKKEPSESIRVVRRITKRLRVLAAYNEMTMPEYLTSILEPLTNEAFAKMVNDLALGGGKPVRKK